MLVRFFCESSDLTFCIKARVREVTGFWPRFANFQFGFLSIIRVAQEAAL